MIKDIGMTLRELRQKCDYTQAEVTDKMERLGLQIKRFHISRWENGYNRPTIEQFLGLCKIYGVRDVYQVFGEYDYSELSYRLNKAGRDKLEEYQQLLIASKLYEPEPYEEKIVEFPSRTAPLYLLGASAGSGLFLDSADYEMVVVPDDVPISATFGLHVSGDSMEPTLFDGETIWVHQQPTLENGDIGIFLVDGDAFVKEYRMTDEGVFLISHNEKYPPRAISEYSETRIYGKVVYPIR